MTGLQLKQARQTAGWTQQQAAARLRITQAYLSLMEKGRRSVRPELAARAVSVLKAPPTVLPLQREEVPSVPVPDLKMLLGALGYPKFSHLRHSRKWNPAEVLLLALNQPDLDSRVVEALPWLVFRFPDLDWSWLIPQAKAHDRQNRLGYVVHLAGEAAKQLSAPGPSPILEAVEAGLERSRLAHEDTLCQDSMPGAERKRLRQKRPASAEHWNLLTDLTVDHLAWVV